MWDGFAIAESTTSVRVFGRFVGSLTNGSVILGIQRRQEPKSSWLTGRLYKISGGKDRS